MSGFRSFAVIGGLGQTTLGSAAIGSRIAKEFLQKGYDVRILARASSTAKASAGILTALGAKVITVDYADVSTIEAALQGVDVVISALGGSAVAANLQVAVVEAASRAGVKLFVPSEYGVATLRATPDLVVWSKRLLHSKLREVGLPFSLFFVGGFNSFLPFFFPVIDGKVLQVGDDNAVFSFTSEKNIVEFIFRALTQLTPSQLANATFHISGTTATLASHVSFIQENHVEPLEVKKICLEEATEGFHKTGDIRFALGVLAGSGMGNTKSADNDLFKDIEWQSLEDTL